MELNILQKLKHKHIVQYLGHETFDNSLHIYLEYMSGGNEEISFHLSNINLKEI